jgi:tight adherence protein C
VNLNTLFNTDNFWFVAGSLLITALLFGLYLTLATMSRQRLQANAPDPAQSAILSKAWSGNSTPDLLLGDMTEAMAVQVPSQDDAKSELQKELLRGGFYRKTALLEYRALRTLLMFTPLGIALLLSLFVAREQMATYFVLGIVGAALGFSLPRLYVVTLGRQRAQAIERSLPMAVDMLTLCLSAGQNLPQALKRVVGEIRSANTVLAEELSLVHQQAELRNVQFALQHFADRSQVPDVQNLSMILSQAEKLGTDLVTALLEFSSSVRTNMRQRAEALANRTSFWMLFPTIFCLFVPAAIVLIGPAYMELSQIGNRGLQRNFRELKQQIEKATPEPTPDVSPNEEALNP